MPDETPGEGKEIARRARTVAAGFADVGLTQAEELLRRLSPEGRAQARREKQARRRREQRVLLLLGLAVAACLLVWVGLGAFLPAMAANVIALAVMIVLVMIIAKRTKPGPQGRQALTAAALPDLTTEMTIWLAAQRRGLPPPAATLTDTLAQRLADLAPQTARLDPRSPAADSVRKLIATELPDLIDHWRAVPLSRRTIAQSDGRTPNAQLTDGLRLIDAEISRMTDHLAHGALDAVAVQGRYLEMKYGGIDTSFGPSERHQEQDPHRG